MGRRKDHSREMLEQMIIESAWKIVGDAGGAAVTARRIAADIGYTPGTIYNVFRSMDDVILRINGRTLDELYTILSDVSLQNQADTPVTRMKAMARRYLKFAQDYRPYWLLLFHQGNTPPIAQADWYADKVCRLFLPLEQILTPFFAASHTELLEDAARTLWASVHGICYLQETGKIDFAYQKPDTTKLMDHLIDTYMAGLNHILTSPLRTCS